MNILVNTTPLELLKFLRDVTGAHRDETRLLNFFLDCPRWKPVADHTRLDFFNQGIQVFYTHDQRMPSFQNIDNVFMEMDQHAAAQARLAGLRLETVSAIPVRQSAYIRYDMTKYPVNITGKQWMSDVNDWVSTQNPNLITMQREFND